MKLRSLLASVVGLSMLVTVSPVFAANSKPIVDTFTVAASSLSPVPITAFTAHDPDGTIAGYLCTDTSTTPSPSNPGWSPTKPITCTTTKTGSQTLYGWAKDALGAVSSAKTATTWVVGSHLHTISSISGLQAALDGKADKYANVIVVAKSGGDFTDPMTAVNSITDASATNPYLVKIMPGVYESGLSMTKDHVDIQGSGEGTTILSVGSCWPGAVQAYATTQLSSLTIECFSTGSAAGIWGGGSGKTLTLKHVSIDVQTLNNGTGTTAGIWLQAGINLIGEDVTVNATSVNSTGNAAGLWTWNAGAVQVSHGRFRADGYIAYGLWHLYDSDDDYRLIDCEGIGTGTFTGIGLYEPGSFGMGYPRIFQGRYSGNTYSLHVYNSKLVGSQLEGPTNIVPGGEVRLVNCCDGSFLPINAH